MPINVFAIEDNISQNDINVRILSYQSTFDWEEIEERYDVPLDKKWTITFSGIVTHEKIDGIVIEKDNRFIPVTIDIIGEDKVDVTPVTPYEPNAQYCLKIMLSNGRRYFMNFYTNDEIPNNQDDNTTLEWQTLNLSEKIDPYDPEFDLEAINIQKSEIAGISFEKDGNILSLDFNINEDNISLENDLQLNSSYVLKLFKEDGSRYKINFITSGLPALYANGQRMVVRVPAMPEKGFYWDYYLAIPSDNHKSENINHKRYLLIDTTNSGVNKEYEDCLEWVEDTLTYRYQKSVQIAEELWSPMLMPAFPRTNVGYYYDNEHNSIYEHALDRDIATLHKKLEDPILNEMLTEEYEAKGHDVNKFVHLDRQLIAMIDHAVEYLNLYNHNVQADKVFLCGYSASGTFTDRFANLWPERIKAVVSGATLDDMMLPLSHHNGEDLIFPIGTYDYKYITGKEFDLSKHNDVARLIFMGEDDTNNVVPYSDCYGDRERDIIIKLWGLEVLPRAKSLIELYGASGGKGMFILDKGVEHGYSEQMEEYMLEFLKANRDSEKPQYPIPSDPEQLKYTLYE